MKKETMYLDYVNNFLTVEKFAEYYNISVSEAIDIINECKVLYNFKNVINDVDKAFSYIVDSVLDFGLYVRNEFMFISKKYKIGTKLNNSDIYQVVEDYKQNLA